MKKLDGRSKRKSKSGSKFQHNSANVCIDGNDDEKKNQKMVLTVTTLVVVMVMVENVLLH